MFFAPFPLHWNVLCTRQEWTVTEIIFFGLPVASDDLLLPSLPVLTPRLLPDAERTMALQTACPLPVPWLEVWYPFPLP